MKILSLRLKILTPLEVNGKLISLKSHLLAMGYLPLQVPQVQGKPLYWMQFASRFITEHRV